MLWLNLIRNKNTKKVTLLYLIRDKSAIIKFNKKLKCYY